MSDGGVSMELALDQKDVLKQRAEKAEMEAKEVGILVFRHRNMCSCDASYAGAKMIWQVRDINCNYRKRESEERTLS